MDFSFQIQPISKEWLISIEDWVKGYREYVRTFRPLITDGRSLIRLGAADEFSPTDVPNLGPWYADLPMGLIDGPVPFRPQDVAQYVLDIMDGKPHHMLPPPPDFEWMGSGRWRQRVKPVMGETHITHIPFGYAESDMPHPNSGTWAESKYEVGYEGLVRDIPQWSVVVGDQTYTDPAVYVKTWIRCTTYELERKRFQNEEYKKKREMFIRSVWVNKKFTNMYGDMKREYLDERKDQKRARAVRDFGAEYADALLQLPISCFGPDFEDDDEEEEDTRKVYDSEDESDNEEEVHKRARTDPATRVLQRLIQNAPLHPL